MLTALDLSLGLKVKWPVIPSQPVLGVKGSRFQCLPFVVPLCAMVHESGSIAHINYLRGVTTDFFHNGGSFMYSFMCI